MTSLLKGATMKRIRTWLTRRQPVIKSLPKSRRHAWRVVDTRPTSPVMYAGKSGPAVESYFVPVYVKFEDRYGFASRDHVLQRAIAALEGE